MSNQALKLHIEHLRQCSDCPEMIPPVVTGQAVRSKVMLVGQAPGDKEGIKGKPFAWTAGKTLFKWFNQIGLSEEDFRSKVYMAAVCRCFPGKNIKGGDRVPNKTEIENCSKWLEREFNLLKPALVIPVGKLAIHQLITADKLNQVVGKSIRVEKWDVGTDVIALPHPSGASTWHRTEPGITLLKKALKLIKQHPAYEALL